jgi:mannose-6-phosphate isomerase-like protein (cupin superfamily)
MLKKIYKNKELYALIITKDFTDEGIHFFTPEQMSQQVAYMRHLKGKIIDPHFHNPVPREVVFTQEVLFIKKGKLQVDFYDEKVRYIESRIVETGDTLLLIKVAHGFKVLEEIEMIEVKQGPYAGDADKTRIVGVATDQVKIVE